MRRLDTIIDCAFLIMVLSMISASLFLHFKGWSGMNVDAIHASISEIYKPILTKTGGQKQP